MIESNLPSHGENKELLLQQDNHQYEIAKLSIDANLQNQREIRAHMEGHRKANIIIVLSIVFTVFVFFMYALHLGKDAFLADTLKVLLGAFGGSGIGYAIGIRKK